MTNLKQKAREEFKKKFVTFHADDSDWGATLGIDPNVYYGDILDFIDYLIDQAVKEERERMKKEIEELKEKAWKYDELCK